jgi:hypothetical protein
LKPVNKSYCLVKVSQLVDEHTGIVDVSTELVQAAVKFLRLLAR